jgi:rRNA-processing protein FCF1|tara:strand:- start:922 stop:1296 length:375 start_codon:yes stop_codon:yes gene_type:complete
MASSYRVILDTNFILAPFKLQIDIFTELERILKFKYEVFVTDGVISELKNIKNMNARGALSLLEDIEIIPTTEKYVDDALLNIASKNTIICTNDKILIKKLKKKGSPVIYIRQKKYLELNGYLR